MTTVATVPDTVSQRPPGAARCFIASTIEDGELTPSMKVKRRAVEARHQDLLDEMHAPQG